MVRTNSKAQQYWLYFLKPYNYLIIRFIFFILGCVINNKIISVLGARSCYCILSTPEEVPHAIKILI